MSWDLRPRGLKSSAWCVLVCFLSLPLQAEAIRIARQRECLRQAWINMLRQDTEILPLAPLCARLSCIYSFYIFYSCPPLLFFVIPLITDMLTKKRPLVISRRPGITWSNLNNNSKFELEMDTKSRSIQIRHACIQIHVPAWQFVYGVWRKWVKLTVCWDKWWRGEVCTEQRGHNTRNGFWQRKDVVNLCMLLSPLYLRRYCDVHALQYRWPR